MEFHTRECIDLKCLSACLCMCLNHRLRTDACTCMHSASLCVMYAHLLGDTPLHAFGRPEWPETAIEDRTSANAVYPPSMGAQHNTNKTQEGKVRRGAYDPLEGSGLNTMGPFPSSLSCAAPFPTSSSRLSAAEAPPCASPLSGPLQAPPDTGRRLRIASS